MKRIVILSFLLVISLTSFGQGGWCTSTSLTIGGCESGTTSAANASANFNSSCSGDETSEGFFWLSDAVEGDSYDFTTISPTLDGLGVSIFGVDGFSCDPSSVNELNCGTNALGIATVSATLSGSQYYYAQVYTLDGSPLSSYTICMTATSSGGGGGGGGGGSTGGVLPTEQDCEGALPVCQFTYNETNAYSGEGNITGEIDGALSCMQGEKNDVWYIFTTQSAGDICFDITPNQMTDDYDWAVYNITNSPCSAIATDASLQVSCNWSSSAGITGPNGGPDFNDEACIPVNNGETYVVNVSQFSTSTNGYTIDFSASTASMWDNSPPVFNGVTSPASGATTLEFNFSENVDCGSIDDTDFVLTGPGGPYTLSNITGDICALGGSYEDVFTADVSPALTTNGTYDLCLVSGSGVISDICGNQASPACFSFTISSNPPCPVLDPISNIEACETITLPAITGTDLTTNQAYFTATGGTGTQYNPGDVYNTPGTVTLYAYDGTAGCDDEQSFDLTIISTVFTVATADPTTCGGIEGSLTLSGADLLASTSYNVGYTVDGVVVASTPITSDASGNIVIPNLQDGDYTDIIIEYNTCSTTDAGPYTLTDPNGPTFTVTSSDPTTCGGVDGSLTLAGLVATTAYDVTYTDDGVTVGPASMTTDGSGNIVISGLDAGTYTNVIVDLGGCATTEVGPFTLTDPSVPAYTVTTSDPTTCGGIDGSLTLVGLTASTAYDVGYTLDGTPVAGTSMTSDGSGNIVISGLGAGAYTDITVTITGCTTIDAGSYTLSDPASPTFAVTSSNPSACGAVDGTLTISGLANNTAYDVGYTNNGTPVAPTSMTSNGSGEIVISLIGAGTYTDITVGLSGCTTLDAGPYTLSDPSSPTFTLTTTNPSICGAADATFTISGLIATTAYDVGYTHDGTPVGVTSMTTDGSGNITVTGLTSGDVTAITVNLLGCIGTDVGPYTITDPAGPSFTVTPSNPTTCGGTDGTLTISGLLATTAYDIDYSLAGTPVGVTSLTTDGSGVIIIGGLSAGTYTDVTADLNGCSTVDAGPYDLVDPNGPTFTVAVINPTSCGGSDGSLTISGLNASTSYNVGFTLNGSPAVPGAMTSDASGNIIISGLSAGTYTNISVELGGCTTVDAGPHTLTDPAAPTFNVTFTSPTTCSGVDGEIVLDGLTAATAYDVTYTLNGSPVGPASMTSDGSGNISISGLSAGTYTDIIVDLLGCNTTAAGPFDLVDPTAPTFTVATTNPSACGVSDGTMTISGLTTSTTYNVEYTLDGTSNGVVALSSDASGDIVITGLGQGTYTDVTVEIIGCTTILAGPYTLTEPAGPTFTLVGVNPTVCAGADGSITISGLNATTSYDINYSLNGTPVGVATMMSDGAGDIVITGLTAGTYSDIIVDLLGCVTTDVGPVSLSDPGSPTFSTSSSNPTTCGGTDGTLTISGLTATTAYNINYSLNGTPVGVASMTTDGSGNIVISGLAAGTYSDIIVELAGCTASAIAPILLVDPNAPAYTVNTTDPSTCGGTDGTISISGLTASTAYNVDYSANGTPAGVTSMTSDASGVITITGLGAGTYTNIDIELLGCNTLTAGPFDLTDPSIPSFTVSPTDPTTCLGTDGTLEIASLTASTNYTVDYSFNGTPVGSATLMSDGSGVITITGLSAGSYTNIEVTLFGCTGTEAGPINLSDPNAPSFVASSTNPTVCLGTDGTIRLTGLAGSTTYDVSYDFNGTPAGTVSLTTDVVGTTVVTGLSAGTYTNLTVTLNSCATTDPQTFTLNDPAGPLAFFSSTNIDFCGGALGTILITNLSSSSTYDITYDDGTTTVGPTSYTSNGSGDITINNISGGNYTVLLTDASSGCTDNGNVAVVDNRTAEVAVANVDIPTITCTDPVATVNGTGSSSVGVSYQWSTLNGTFNPTSPTPTNSISTEVSAAGDYTITVTNLSNGCSASATVSVSENTTLPTADAGSNDVLSCLNPLITLDGSNSATGATISYSWSTSDGFIGGAGNAVTDFTNLAGTYTLTVLDASNGCSSTATMIVTGDLTPPNLQTATVNPVCENVPLIDLDGYVNISGGVWTGTQGASSSIFDVSVGPGTYSVSYEVTDPVNFCTATETIDVTVNPNPVLIVNSQAIACVGDSVNVSVAGADSYVWSNGGTSASFYHQVLPGDAFYSVVGTNAATGCIGSTDLIIEGVDPSVSMLGVQSNVVYPYYAEITAVGSDVDGYTWETQGNTIGDSPNLEHVFGQGQHTLALIGTDSNSGCSDTTQVTFELLDPANIFVPNAFSPNGDGNNDFFRVGATFVECQFLIFNRWGEMIYSDQAQTPTWNGKDLSGNDVQQDVYIYKLVATLSTGEQYEKTGQVTLIK